MTEDVTHFGHNLVLDGIFFYADADNGQVVTRRFTEDRKKVKHITEEEVRRGYLSMVIMSSIKNALNDRER